MAKSDKQRQRESHERRKAQGLLYRSYWATREQHEALKRFLHSLKKQDEPHARDYEQQDS